MGPRDGLIEYSTSFRGLETFAGGIGAAITFAKQRGTGGAGKARLALPTDGFLQG